MNPDATNRPSVFLPGLFATLVCVAAVGLTGCLPGDAGDVGEQPGDAATAETGAVGIDYVEAAPTTNPVGADGGVEGGATDVGAEAETRARAVGTNYGGLFTSSETNRTHWTPALGQYWLKANWSDLEPSPGVYNWAPITNYLSAHPGVNVRLHINGGDNAPRWLATYSGAFVSVTNTRDSIDGECGRYWVQGYKDHFRTFVTALGARFDGVAGIASVNNFGNSLIYDEPWIMGGDAPSAARLFAAGLDHDSDLSAQNDAVAALIAAFPTTVIEMPGHSDWDYPADASGRITYDWAGGRALFNNLHSLYGKHIIFTDYGLGPDDYTAAAPSLATASSYYGWMHALANLGYPIGFQLTLTSSGGSPTSAQMTAAVQAAVDMHARWVEHSDFSLLTEAQVRSFDMQLKADVE